MTTDGVSISTTSSIAVGGNYALPAVETVLNELSKYPGAGSLALNIADLHFPLQAMISVPVEIRVVTRARTEWQLSIQAASKPGMYPRFTGLLTLAPATQRSCELQLTGRYLVPLGAFGHAVDSTLLRGAAQASIYRFVREIAQRVSTLARWANLV